MLNRKDLEEAGKLFDLIDKLRRDRAAVERSEVVEVEFHSRPVRACFRFEPGKSATDDVGCSTIRQATLKSIDDLITRSKARLADLGVKYEPEPEDE